MLERHPEDGSPWHGEYKESARQMEWEDWQCSWNACRAAMLNQSQPVAETDTASQQFESLAGKVVSGWIPCSERIPPENTGVLVATEFDGPGDWRMKWGTRVPGHPDAKNGWFIPGASWAPSHWQPLPEPPCK
ncbi:DUF551 domain-containing protein [Cronobacter sakazakii]|nr:DUF551 domain-containing protein [Cronobacter sakazakii]